MLTSIDKKIEQFVQTYINAEQHIKQIINLRMSDRLAETIPSGNQQYYYRTATQLVYLLRNSPFRNQILAHLGFDNEMVFHLEEFTKNFNEIYFVKLFGNGITKHDNDKKSELEIKELQNTIELLIKTVDIYSKLFGKLKDMFVQSNNKTISLDEYKTILPNEEERKLINKAKEVKL